MDIDEGVVTRKIVGKSWWSVIGNPKGVNDKVKQEIDVTKEMNENLSVVGSGEEKKLRRAQMHLVPCYTHGMVSLTKGMKLL